jgi:prepilin-type N-terminal cleavage/methylation domain
MNNKGFTLIELLAVVILLITISLFVMPRIVDVIKEGDKTKENITKNKIIDAAKEYTSNYDTNFLNDLVNVGDSKIIKKEDLLNSKLIDDKDLDELAFTNIVVTLKENNKIEYTLSSNNIETIHLIIDLDGGKGINNTGDYVTGTTITLSTPTKEDSVFSTWKVENGNSILSGNIITIGSQATTIKAVWTKIFL